MKKITPKIWNKAVQNLEKVVPEDDYITWIAPITFIDHEDSEVHLLVPNRTVRKGLENHYIKTLLAEALTRLSGHTLTISISACDDNVMSEITAKYKPEDLPLNPKYTFDLFIKSPCNQLAYDAALAVADNPAETYNPLYICGGSGLGKSHLLHAIGHTIRNTMPEKKVIYCSAEKFMYEMVNHLREKKMDLFRNSFRTADVLLIDDVHFMSGKTGTQEEFFYTFNALYEGHKQIVVTSGRLPREMPEMDERLRTRFEWGLIAKIQPTDQKTIVNILNRISESKNMVVPYDVINLLASSNISDTRVLEGMILRLEASSALLARHIDLNMAREVLLDIHGICDELETCCG